MPAATRCDDDDDDDDDDDNDDRQRSADAAIQRRAVVVHAGDRRDVIVVEMFVVVVVVDTLPVDVVDVDGSPPSLVVATETVGVVRGRCRYWCQRIRRSRWLPIWTTNVPGENGAASTIVDERSNNSVENRAMKNSFEKRFRELQEAEKKTKTNKTYHSVGAIKQPSSSIRRLLFLYCDFEWPIVDVIGENVSANNGRRRKVVAAVEARIRIQIEPLEVAIQIELDVPQLVLRQPIAFRKSLSTSIALK
jgi:hypothetical protein